MTPKTEAELADIIATAHAPLAISGGGTRGYSAEGARLSVSGLSGIELYEPGALTIVAKAGTRMSEIEAALAKENQRLPFEPMDHRALLGTDGAPTIGGVIAANVSGPRRIQSGAARDYMLGVRFVDGAGTVLKNGGRVMKNVTGYDLVKLMTGSYGTLGVLSEVALKVLPRTDVVASIMIDGLSDAEAVRAMSDALGSPFEVSGAAHMPRGPEEKPVTMIRIEGFEGSVKYRSGKLVDLLAGYGAARVETDPEKTDAMWTGIRDVAPFHGVEGDVWRVSCKPSDGPQLSAALSATDTLFDWGGGLIWALTPEGTDARASLGAYDGHATLVRASAETKARLGTFQPQPAPIEAITAGLRAKFDPKNILNTGLMQPRQEG
ncbi:hypothetical protein SuNHUV7_11800 (plasmid) [Pseudoseohaeicola sp. NH-UV-7]|uniref:FAD-binding protein n=1 Tax=Sulfitobacter sp. TBRI5 TaxID=2989732 RepID=UPI003A738EEF